MPRRGRRTRGAVPQGCDARGAGVTVWRESPNRGRPPGSAGCRDPATASIEDRAAACLVLLYAQHVTTIVALTVDDITVTGHGTYLKLGREPVHLLPAVADLITALPIAKPFGAARTLADPKWLFPGKRAGHHQHPTSLMNRLNRLGIITRSGRNTAMLRLATTVPPAVLASLIGIDVGTATRWAEHANGNWTTYAAELSR